jgi:hypothetical protein
MNRYAMQIPKNPCLTPRIRKPGKSYEISDALIYLIRAIKTELLPSVTSVKNKDSIQAAIPNKADLL